MREQLTEISNQYSGENGERIVEKMALAELPSHSALK
jgi:hypothetical protein